MTEKDFLPFPEVFDSDTKKSTKPKILKSTAIIFMAGVKSGELPMKIIAAFSPYIDEISGLIE